MSSNATTPLWMTLLKHLRPDRASTTPVHCPTLARALLHSPVWHAVPRTARNPLQDGWQAWEGLFWVHTPSLFFTLRTTDGVDDPEQLGNATEAVYDREEALDLLSDPEFIVVPHPADRILPSEQEWDGHAFAHVPTLYQELAAMGLDPLEPGQLVLRQFRAPSQLVGAGLTCLMENYDFFLETAGTPRANPRTQSPRSKLPVTRDGEGVSMQVDASGTDETPPPIAFQQVRGRQGSALWGRKLVV